MLNRRLTFRDVHFETGPGIVFTAYRFAGDVAHDGVFQKKQTLETPTGVFPVIKDASFRLTRTWKSGF